MGILGPAHTQHTAPPWIMFSHTLIPKQKWEDLLYPRSVLTAQVTAHHLPPTFRLYSVLHSLQNPGP